MDDVKEIVEGFEEPKSKSEVSPPDESATTATGSAVAAVEAPGVRVGNFRWVICALLFFAATVNYIDRQVIGI
jgi:hypothetical protein